MSETGMIDKPLAPWGTSVWRREGRMSSCFHTVEREEHSYHSGGFRSSLIFPSIALSQTDPS